MLETKKAEDFLNGITATSLATTKTIITGDMEKSFLLPDW